MLSIINILTLQKKTRPVIVPQKARRVGLKQGPASSQLISNPLNSLNSIVFNKTFWSATNLCLRYASAKCGR